MKSLFRQRGFVRGDWRPDPPKKIRKRMDLNANWSDHAYAITVALIPAFFIWMMGKVSYLEFWDALRWYGGILVIISPIFIVMAYTAGRWSVIDRVRKEESGE